jgi:hypothetical protein
VVLCIMLVSVGHGIKYRLGNLCSASFPGSGGTPFTPLLSSDIYGRRG